MRIDTNASNTFIEIVNKLRNRYEVIFDENKMYFNNKHIDLRKTPKDYNIHSGDFIEIND